MSSSKKYAAPRVVVQIEIYDFAISAPRKYTGKIRSRSVKTGARELIGKARELQPTFLMFDAEIDEKNVKAVELDDEQERAVLEISCELVTLLTEEPKGDAPDPGDLLLQQWEDDQIMDEDITYYLLALTGADPQPRPN